MTTGLLFPTLTGQGWSVHKKPKFDVRVAQHVTGREARAGKYATPLWDFELTFDGLDMTATGAYGGLGAESMQTLAGFFLQCQGKANPFVYVDPTDNLAVGQNVGTADGVTKSFYLTRSIGSYVGPIGALVSVTGVYFDGAPVLGWIVAQPNVLTFGTAPPAGVTITADFKFGYACRFSEDVQDFEEFMAMLSTVKTLTFQSVRDIVPFEIVGPRLIILTESGDWIVPADFNSARNRISVFAGGGGGGFGYGSGGGGGAFTFRDNVALTPGASIPVIIGPGGVGRTVSGLGSDYGGPGGDTDFNSGQIIANGANYIGIGSYGGGAGICVPTEGARSGGNGGPYNYYSGGGGGGGGAGGPNGDGADGGTGRSPTYLQHYNGGGAGGAADGGSPGADASPSTGGEGGESLNGSPGGTAGTPASPAGGDGEDGSGGGGGMDGPGGAGSAATNWFKSGVWYGAGSGGGGGSGGFIGGPGGGFGGGGGAGGGGGPGADAKPGGVVIEYDVTG